MPRKRLAWSPFLLAATHQRNEQQKHFLLDKVLAQFGADLSAHTIAVWGLSFKPGTDDVREAPALSTVEVC